jgi:hypothetical protein
MPGSGALRLAEAAGVLSLATDLAMGQPLEHGLCTAVLGVRTAAALGLPEQDLAAVFYTGLLHFAGCTAGSEIDVRFLGDELAVRPQLMAALYGSRFGLVATAARAAHPGSPAVARAAAMARSAVGGLAELRRLAASHCEVAELLGARMGLTEQVQAALRHLYERWDGKGLPGDLRGEQVPRLPEEAGVAGQAGGAGDGCRQAAVAAIPEAVLPTSGVAQAEHQGADGEGSGGPQGEHAEALPRRERQSPYVDRVLDVQAGGCRPDLL